MISELNISSCHCYSDSQVALALCWIRNTGRSWKPFVQNRVSESRKLFPVECWKHIPGIKNPADIPSRGTTPLELLVSKLWRDGPELPFEQKEQHIDIPPQCLDELQASEKQAVYGLLANGVVSSGVQNLLECKNFSKLSQLINTVTNVLRFCSILRRKKRATVFDRIENKFAELLLIKSAQVSIRSHNNFSTWERQLSIFEDDDGVLRCCGRIENAANQLYSTKHPVILPGNHHLTTLYVHQAHARVLHNGVRETLGELRPQFWVIKGRSVVKKYCTTVTCVGNIKVGRSCHIPPPPSLLAFRI